MPIQFHCVTRLFVLIIEEILIQPSLTQQQYNHKYLCQGETERESVFATAGSEITNSIVLCCVTCLLSYFLLATSEGRKVWRKRNRQAKPSMLPVPLIFFSLCAAKQENIYLASACPSSQQVWLISS